MLGESGHAIFNRHARQVACSDGSKFTLTSTQSSLLRKLIDAHPTRMTAERLLQETNISSQRALQTHLSTLRRRKGLANVILTADASGYGVILPQSKASDAKKRFDWPDVKKGAKKVRNRAFGKRFAANVIVTFQGTSGIFGNLVIALNKKAQFELPVFMLLVRNWTRSSGNLHPPILTGFDIHLGEGIVIYIPSGFKKFIWERSVQLNIAVIDDIVVSGVVPAAIKAYLQSLLSKNKHPGSARSSIGVKTLFVCFACPKALRRMISGHAPDYAAEWTETEDFTVPWPTVFYHRPRSKRSTNES